MFLTSTVAHVLLCGITVVLINGFDLTDSTELLDLLHLRPSNIRIESDNMTRTSWAPPRERLPIMLLVSNTEYSNEYY